MTNKQERYIKNQIRKAIANKEGIENLNNVSHETINKAFETKSIYNYKIKTNDVFGELYFAFIDNDTGYHYNSTILKGGE